MENVALDRYTRDLQKKDRDIDSLSKYLKRIYEVREKGKHMRELSANCEDGR